MIHIKKEQNGFIEYGFATSEFIPGFEAVYLNHLQAISRFIHAFETEAGKLIQHANEYRVNIAEIIGEKYHEKPKLNSPLLVPDSELSFVAALERDPAKRESLLSLTKSEKIVLRHYLAGSTTQEIAKKLFRSPRTIETHLENVKAKMGVHSRSQLFEVLMPFIDALADI